MEQTIIDFFVKSSELILQSRLKTAKTSEAAPSSISDPTLFKFQLPVEQKFNFNTKIPPQWSIQSNKLLVLEFFLSNRTTQEKFLVEQWIFELNQVADEKLKFTIDSPLTLHKKLSVLLRSISLLTMILPLNKYFLSDKNSTLWKYYTLEHSINFTRHNLSHWHASVHEEKNLTSYTNPDLVLPGRTFAFKVSYPPSLQFLINMIENEINPSQPNEIQIQVLIDENYFAPKLRDRAVSEKSTNINTNLNLLSINKNVSDSTKNNLSTGAGSRSLKEINPTTSEGGSGSISPIGSLLTFTPIETQKSLQFGGSRRKSSGGANTWTAKNSLGSRQRFATIDSGSGEYDMFLYEDKAGTLAEVESGKESEDEDNKISPNRLGVQDLKWSGNVKQISKIIEHSEDDKLAEIIQVVEELKDHFNQAFEEVGAELGSKKDSNDKKKRVKGTNKKGFKFYQLGGESENTSAKNTNTLSNDYENLGALYAKLKFAN